MWKSITTVLLAAVCLIGGADAAEVIRIRTRSTELVYLVKQDGTLAFRHYGLKVGDESGYADNMFSPAEAFPSSGGQTYIEPALSVVHHDGSIVTQLKFGRYETRGNETIIYLADKVMPLEVELHAETFPESDVLKQWVVVRNEEPGEIVLKSCSSAFLNFRPGQYWLTHFHGAAEGEMQREQTPLGHGFYVLDSKRGTRVGRYDNPSFLLSGSPIPSEDTGLCIGGAMEWSGNFRFTFETDATNSLNVTCGTNPVMGERKLSPGESYCTPAMLLTYSEEGCGRISREFHDWARKHCLRHGEEPMPIVLNSWEGAYFSFNEKVLAAMMDDAADMGIEMFVLDDGWFGNKYPRDNAAAGLGDWQVNRKKLPHGLNYLSDYAARRGLKFGIWVEPEMVNPKSELAERHPEWIIASPGREPMYQRNQLQLDLSNPDVQDFVFKSVDDLLNSDKDIVYVKWDANRHIDQPGSTYLPADRQMHIYVDYINGLYSVYDRLRAAHPDVNFQCCSSGGGRLDYGALRWHEEFWASDNTDPLSRLKIQFSESMIYPPKAMASHISASPNHQTGRIFPLKFRIDVAMSGRLGMELQPKNLTEDERIMARNAIAEYKRWLRPLIVSGDLYRLISPYDNDFYASEMFVSKDGRRAALYVWCMDYDAKRSRPVLRLRGLDPSAKYRLTELNSDKRTLLGSQEIFTGDFLMNVGVVSSICKPYQSGVYYFEAVD